MSSLFHFFPPTSFSSRPPPLPPLPTTSAAVRRRSRRPTRLTATATDGESSSGTALLWFKQDLRTDDHPGLVQAAANHSSVVPFYVFDRRILSGYSDEILRLLITALEGLKKSLQNQGSDLLVYLGSAEVVIPKLVEQVKATHIFVEEDVEYTLRSMVETVKASLAGSPKFVNWRVPFYGIENLAEMPESYNEFQKLQVPLTSPVVAPELPLLALELDQDELPTFVQIKEYLDRVNPRGKKSWTSLKGLTSELSFKKTQLRKVDLSDDNDGMQNEYLLSSNGSRNRICSDSSFFLSMEGNVVKGGTDVALNALAAYLRYFEGTSRDDWQELHGKLRISESRNGSSFYVLFGFCLVLGILSRRRVHYETIKYEKERNGGSIPLFGYSVATVTAAVDTLKSMEWFWLLNLMNQRSDNGRFEVRVWRWKGYLIQYTVNGNEGPAVLLVHGFGAFLDHYRDNICSLAEDGHHVWAITLLGFGKSEKPNIIFTEFIWAELLRDFIIDVVGEPVHLVGNSIGGYIASVVAGLWSPLIKSLILVNTAGSIVPGYSFIDVTYGGKTSGFAWLGARMLLSYLQLRLRKIVKDFYPTKPERVDDWLINQMLRASYDPGVLIVLESVFGLKLSVPLNYLMDSFGGKVLVIQGTKDPLSKYESRVLLFKENCNDVTIKEMDAGHCPHDELPELVNSTIGEWTMSIENSLCHVNRI